MNLTLILKLTGIAITNLPPLLRGRFQPGCFVGVVSILWTDRGCVLLPRGPLLPPCAVTQLRAGPRLFRDVLIKQHGEPESHTACTDRDHDSVPQYLFWGGRAITSQAKWQPQTALLKIGEYLTLWQCLHRSFLREWTCTYRGSLYHPHIIHGSEAEQRFDPNLGNPP